MEQQHHNTRSPAEAEFAAAGSSSRDGDRGAQESSWILSRECCPRRLEAEKLPGCGGFRCGGVCSTNKLEWPLISNEIRGGCA